MKELGQFLFVLFCLSMFLTLLGCDKVPSVSTGSEYDFRVTITKDMSCKWEDIRVLPHNGSTYIVKKDDGSVWVIRQNCGSIYSKDCLFSPISSLGTNTVKEVSLVLEK